MAHIREMTTSGWTVDVDLPPQPQTPEEDRQARDEAAKKQAMAKTRKRRRLGRRLTASALKARGKGAVHDGHRRAKRDFALANGK